MDRNDVPAAPFRRHPWEVVRARFFGKIVAEALPAGAPARVLDVKAGDGYLARSLLGGIPVGSTVTCVDSNYSDVDLQRFASPPTIGLSFSRARPAGRFDVILLLNVIEHVADDRAFLDELLRDSLDANGLVVVSVPAWDLLYGQSDLALKHFRRYQPAQCRTPHLIRAVAFFGVLPAQHQRPIDHDDDMVARSQGFALDALASQLSAAAPFNRTLNRFPGLCVLGGNLKEGMRIAIEELEHVRLDSLLLILKVGGRKGVMRVGSNAQNGHAGEGQNE